MAASGILNGNTAAPSGCWTTPSIRAPFRLVTCRPRSHSPNRAAIVFDLLAGWTGGEGQQVANTPVPERRRAGPGIKRLKVKFIIPNAFLSTRPLLPVRLRGFASVLALNVWGFYRHFPQSHAQVLQSVLLQGHFWICSDAHVCH